MKEQTAQKKAFNVFIPVIQVTLHQYQSHWLIQFIDKKKTIILKCFQKNIIYSGKGYFDYSNEKVKRENQMYTLISKKQAN